MFELQRRPLSYVWDFEKDFEKILKDPAIKNWKAHSEIIETDNEYQVSVDVPGVKKEDLKIDLTDNVLTISAKRNTIERKENEKLIFKKNFMESFKEALTCQSQLILIRFKRQWNTGYSISPSLN